MLELPVLSHQRSRAQATSGCDCWCCRGAPAPGQSRCLIAGAGRPHVASRCPWGQERGMRACPLRAAQAWRGGPAPRAASACRTQHCLRWPAQHALRPSTTDLDALAGPALSQRWPSPPGHVMQGPPPFFLAGACLCVCVSPATGTARTAESRRGRVCWEGATESCRKARTAAPNAHAASTPQNRRHRRHRRHRRFLTRPSGQ